MHELAVCQDLLAQVETIARDRGAASVGRITLQIGPLSGVEPELLAQAFTIARAGGVAADAVLAIEPLPVRVHCLACGAETKAAPNRLLCGRCGEYHTRLIAGDELLLRRLELWPVEDQRIQPCATPVDAA